MNISTCSYADFITKVRNKKSIIFWGAGKNIRKKLALDFIDDVAAENPNTIVVDSNPSEEIITPHNSFMVYEKERIISEIKPEEAIIVITPNKKESILSELELRENTRTVECYDLAIMCALFQDELAIRIPMPKSLRITSEQKIPKKIHYCWFGGKEIPDEYKRYMESWTKYCPDYEIIKWSEENYDINKNKYMKQAYESKKWGFVPDYARLDIIYNEGGIYLDTDVELIRNMDELLYQDAYVGIENGVQINCGLGFGAVQGNPAIKLLRDMYEDISFVNEDGSLNMIASPAYLTDWFLSKGYVANGNYQIVNGVTILPEKVLAVKSYRTFRMLMNPDGYSIHHYSGSWLDEDALKRVIESKKVYENS